MGRARKHTGTLRAFLILFKKDVARELRTKEMLVSMGLYAVLVLIIYGAMLSQVSNGADILEMSGGLVWALIVFTSLLGLGRSFSYEKENGCIEGILLTPIDRGAIFLAKAASNALFLLAVEVVAIPLFCFLFLGNASVSPGAGLVVVPLVLGTVGIAAVGTMLSTITSNVRGKDVMLAVLFIPLLFPLLYACVTATSCAVVGAEYWMDTFLPCVVIAVAYDVIMSLVCWVLYDFAVRA